MLNKYRCLNRGWISMEQWTEKISFMNAGENQPGEKRPPSNQNCDPKTQTLGKQTGQ